MFELMEQFFDQYQEEIARIALWVCNMASLTGGENMNGLNDELYCILRETFFFFQVSARNHCAQNLFHKLVESPG